MSRLPAFLAERLPAPSAYGVSLTVGLAVLAAAGVAFAHIVEDVLHRAGLTWLDGPVNAAVPRLRTNELSAVMRGLTLLASAPAVVTVVVLGGAFLRVRAGTWRPAILLAVLAGGAALLDLAVKLAVHRPRPPARNAIAHAAGFAFPSGHTTEAAVYAGLAYLVALTARALWSRVCVWAGALLLGIGVGLSRVYLGVHWLTDVLGGWALGTAWLAFVVTVAATIGRLRPEADLIARPRSAATASPGDTQDRAGAGGRPRSRRATSRRLWRGSSSWTGVIGDSRHDRRTRSWHRDDVPGPWTPGGRHGRGGAAGPGRRATRAPGQPA